MATIKDVDVIIEKVIDIIKEYVNVNEQIDADSNFSDFGINSVNFIKIIVGVENEFDFEFYDSDLVMDRFKSIRELSEYILTRI